ncbi:hypothetical protein, conserved [Eimeria tenella]|uniref:Uncharacterized protein n=1 Tax=Eimeria tenella TaxID=5802 RepID=U6KRU0_EIMTE|nr:hypothetical protein, conserved [Eimeria tenella]CDJ39069.1 hypothetical protein, conserved [Eimeria tenella]|eukprot:XP_013229824.1 hypothetical protein, conserved [Eimeria tenella]
MEIDSQVAASAVTSAEAVPNLPIDFRKPLTAATQEESFAAIGEATAALLEAAFCSQDTKVVQKLVEALTLLEKPQYAVGDSEDGESEGPKDEAGNAVPTTPQQETEHEPIPPTSDCTVAGFFSLEAVPFGSLIFSGSLSLSQQGTLSFVGPGKGKPLNVMPTLFTSSHSSG